MFLLQWLYSTLPFIQLGGNRGNIIGVIWSVSMTIIFFNVLRKTNYSFGAKGKLHHVGLLAIAGSGTWFFYRIMDECLTMNAIIFNKPELFGIVIFNAYFWWDKSLSVITICLGVYYLFHILNLKQFFSITNLSFITLLSMLIIQVWIVNTFSVDYALLKGEERIRTFWSYYPLLYSFYTLLFFTLLKRRDHE